MRRRRQRPRRNRPMGILGRVSTLIKSNVNDLIAGMQDPGKEIAQMVRDKEDSARDSRARKWGVEAELTETKKALQEQSVYVDQLTAGLKALEARVRDVKLRQGTLREKARASKRGVGLGGATSAFADFERMSNKIEAVEAESALGDELAGRSAAAAETDRKLAALGASSEVDDALAELKKKLDGWCF